MVDSHFSAASELQARNNGFKLQESKFCLAIRTNLAGVWQWNEFPQEGVKAPLPCWRILDRGWDWMSCLIHSCCSSLWDLKRMSRQQNQSPGCSSAIFICVGTGATWHWESPVFMDVITFTLHFWMLNAPVANWSCYGNVTLPFGFAPFFADLGLCK